MVVPCFNEELTIAGLVQGIRQHLPTVIVIDDGCTDQTAARASEAGAQVVLNERNLGKGATLKIGLKTAQQRGFEFAVTLDGDGQHRPEDIPAFLHCAEQTSAALVIGNRMHDARAIPWVRRVVNRWMSRQISERTGQSLPDTQCGFRLVNLKACTALGLQADHFEIESEMLLAFVQAGYRVEFVPIQVVGKGLHSHIHPVKDTWRWLKWWRRVHCA